jgi:hypothetical protein
MKRITLATAGVFVFALVAATLGVAYRFMVVG